MSDHANPGDPVNPVMTSAEVMEWLGISRPVLAAQIQAHEIPVSRIGSDYRFWRPSLLRTFFSQEEIVEPGRDVITPTDLAEHLRMSKATVRQRIADGSIPAHRIGNTYRIWWPTIRAKLEAGEDFSPARRGESLS